MAYPGDRFASPLTAIQRANLALGEIDLAMKKPCPQDRDEDRLDLTLNRIGAHVMRARARAEASSSPEELGVALRDADVATSELRAFAQTKPDAAAKLWMWIAMAFRRAGRPLDALVFLARIEKKCCVQQQAALQATALEADILFELAVYSAATRLYVEWLRAVDEPSLCGRNRSLANVAELRRRGFEIRESSVERSSVGRCVAGSEWEPYVGLPK